MCMVCLNQKVLVRRQWVVQQDLCREAVGGLVGGPAKVVGTRGNLDSSVKS